MLLRVQKAVTLEGNQPTPSPNLHPDPSSTPALGGPPGRECSGFLLSSLTATLNLLLPAHARTLSTMGIPSGVPSPLARRSSFILRGPLPLQNLPTPPNKMARLPCWPSAPLQEPGMKGERGSQSTQVNERMSDKVPQIILNAEASQRSCPLLCIEAALSQRAPPTLTISSR